MSDDLLHVVSAVPLPPAFPADAFEDRVRFTSVRTDEQLRAAVADADVLYTWRVPEDVPAASPQLKWIQVASAGVDHLRGLPVWKSDVVITSSTGIHTVPMSEHLFALLLALTRGVPAMVRAQDRHHWMHDAGSGLTELRGKTLGIIGWGKIGDGIAHLAAAFGMRVVGTRFSTSTPRHTEIGSKAYVDPPWLPDEELEGDIVYPSAQLTEVLAESDVVAVLLPLTDRTRGLIGGSAFDVMRKGTILINLGRGQVIDEAALIEALRRGTVGAAGLDVFDPEPLPASSPLWDMPNVLISPHLGGVSGRTRERGAHFFAVNLARYLEGQELLNLVDRSAGY